MVKANVHNVILIMSGGVGSRFGADCPKQYCMMGGKKVIEYATDASFFAVHFWKNVKPRRQN